MAMTMRSFTSPSTSSLISAPKNGAAAQLLGADLERGLQPGRARMIKVGRVDVIGRFEIAIHDVDVEAGHARPATGKFISFLNLT
jgi:hypothetical protein